MPLVTINHSFGIDGKGIAQAVAKKLGVELFDDEKLRASIYNAELSTASEYRFDQQAPGFWERLRSREPQVFLDVMESVVYNLAQNGEGVIIGHGSQMLLRDFSCAFHVRLLSNINLRIESIVSNQDISPEAAEKLITRYDKSQKAFFQYAFQIDFENPSLYDLVINMGKMKNVTITNLIVEALESEDVQTCSFDAITSMKRLSLERKIHAKLLKNNLDISTLNIAVSDIGKVEITGAVLSQDEKDKIIELVKNVHGVSHISDDLSIWIYTV